MIFEALNAGHGDCLLLHLPGVNGAQKLILVDGGPGSAARQDSTKFRPSDELIRRLSQIAKGSKGAVKLDLVVCTHIDDDHIAGIDWLYRCLGGDKQFPKDAPSISAPVLWFNSFSKLVEPAQAEAAALLNNTPSAIAASVSQGESLTGAAVKTDTEINPNADGGLILAGHAPKGFGKTKITVVAPDKTALEALQKAWLAELKKKKDKLRAGTSAITAAVPAAKLDQAIPNLSSIVMLVTSAGKTVLLTGDARGDHVLSGLKTTRKLKKGKLHVDVLKVPHHGAEGNNPADFLEAVTADHYVFSANGKDQNPDPPVLELIAAQAASGRKFTMHFTNGDMAYDLRKDGSLPTLGGKPCATLKDAIKLLRRDPKVKANVTFSFRKSTDPSLIITL
jgi:beta-lactamase superfamily II metal-dependent hydrolase